MSAAGLYSQWLFYDGDCPFCIRLARRFERQLNKRGIGLAPIQTSWVQPLLTGLDDPLHEMLLLTPGGKFLGGADAAIALARTIWWAKPIYLLAQLWPMKLLFAYLYRLIANHRYCRGKSCQANAPDRRL